MSVERTPAETEDVRPRGLILELVKACNLRCGYCYYAQRDEAYDPSTRMSDEVARRSVDLLLADGPPDEDPHLHFFGGEPLLDLPLLERTVEYAERRASEEGHRFTFEVTTNGTRLTDDAIAFLNAHRVRVGISLDGPPEVQDESRPAASGSSYEMAVPNVRRLLASRAGTDLETHCTVVITRRDCDLVAIGAHLEEIGFEKILLTPATDLEGESHGFSVADLPTVLAAYEDLGRAYERSVSEGRPVAVSWFPNLMNRLLSGVRKSQFCGGGRDFLGVAADGTLNLCYRFYEDDEHALGSVAEGIDRGVTETLQALPLDARSACSKCWARSFCGGGCHHENVTVGGALDEPNPVTCQIFRHSMDLTLDAWARLSRTGRIAGRIPPQPPTDAMNDADNPAPRPFLEHDRPAPAVEAHVRDLDDEKVVYDPASHEVFVLNATAALIFELCDGERSVGGILRRLEARFDAPEDVLRRDLHATLDDLRSKRLVA